jgi:hypothetical protein
MQRQLLRICVLGVSFFVGLWVKIKYFPTLNRETVFYFYSFFWIFGLLALFLSADLIWRIFKQHLIKTEQIEIVLNRPNRRQSYRVAYPKQLRPVVLIDKSGGPIMRQLEFPVVDLSEQGICFLDDGSLGSTKEIEGVIRFHGGQLHQIAGRIVRGTENCVCIQLHGGLPWKTVLQEQQNLISQEIPSGKRAIL